MTWTGDIPVDLDTMTYEDLTNQTYEDLKVQYEPDTWTLEEPLE